MEPNTFQSPRRNLFTAKPMFTALSRATATNDSVFKIRNTKTSKSNRNLPNLMKGNSLDSSKENLSYQNYLTKVNSATKIDQKTVVATYLNTLRRDYDQMAKNSKHKQVQINRLKKEIQFMKRRHVSQQSLQKTTSTKLLHFNSEVKDVFQKHQAMKMQTKVLNQIACRMKRDEIYYKNSLRVKQSEANAKAKQVKEKNQILIHEQQNLHKMQCTLQRMKSHYEQNQGEREKKFEDYTDKIDSLEDKDKFIEERNERTFQLLSIQLNDVHDSRNKVARQVYLANRVCDSLLEHRISSLLEQYQKVQDAFHTINTKTSIGDPNFLAHKFFSYGQLSQSLMKSIYLSEQQLEVLNAQNEVLQQSLRELTGKNYEEQKIISLRKCDWVQEKRRYMEQATSKELKLGKLHEWIDKKFQALGCNELTGTDPISMKFRNLCAVLKQQISSFENKQKLTDRKYTTAGIRVKKLIREVSIEEEYIRKTEAHQMNQIIETQNHFLSENRSIVKMNNRVLRSKMLTRKDTH